MGGASWAVVCCADQNSTPLPSAGNTPAVGLGLQSPGGARLAGCTPKHLQNLSWTITLMVPAPTPPAIEEESFAAGTGACGGCLGDTSSHRGPRALGLLPLASSSSQTPSQAAQGQPWSPAAAQEGAHCLGCKQAPLSSAGMDSTSAPTGEYTAPVLSPPLGLA